MTAFLPLRMWIVWLALMLATGLTWWTAVSHPFASAALQIGGALAVALGFGKAWLIGMHFMHVRESPPLLRRAFDVWAVLIGGLVVMVVLR